MEAAASATTSRLPRPMRPRGPCASPTARTRCTGSRSASSSSPAGTPAGPARQPHRGRVSDRHLRFSPARSMPRLDVPATSLVRNAEGSAQRFPEKPFLIFYDTPVTFAEFLREVERIAGFLERECGVTRGDRVLLYMQ